MPRVPQFTKRDIASKALDIISQVGVSGVTARNLGYALGVSSSPIFTMFNSMEEVLIEARHLGQTQFLDYVADVTDYTPAFKEFGMRMIRFARENNNLFLFLFLDEKADNTLLIHKVKRCLEETEQHFSLSAEQSIRLFQQMWTFACGLSVICSQNPAEYSDEEISEMLSLQFSAVIHHLKSNQTVANIKPQKKLSASPALPAQEKDHVPIRSLYHQSPQSVLCEALSISQPYVQMECLRKDGWIAQHIPAMLPMFDMQQNKYHFGTVWEHTMAVLQNLQSESLSLRVAALFHDIGKTLVRTVDKKGNVHFIGHEKIGAKLTRKVLSQLGFPTDFINEVALLIKFHMLMKPWGDDASLMRDKSLRKVQYLCSNADTFESLLLLVDADNRSHAEGYCMPQQVSWVRKASLRLVEEGTAMFDFELPISQGELLQMMRDDKELAQRCYCHLLKLAFANPRRTREAWLHEVAQFQQRRGVRPQ